MGKQWACLARSVDHTSRALEMGAGLIFHFSDLVAVKTALDQMQRQFAPLGFTFDDRRNGYVSQPTPSGNEPGRLPKAPMFIRGNIASKERYS
jgi:hypothetical protein